MTVTKLAFLDTETTGLDPDQHEVWEVGLVLRDEAGAEREFLWQLPVDLGRADPMALKISRWYDRRWPWPAYSPPLNMWPDPSFAENEKRISGAVDATEHFVVPEDRMGEWASLFAELTDGTHLVGAVISFDEERLRRLLRRHHACPTWHYHLIDVENLAVGAIAGAGAITEEAAVALNRLRRPPWDSNELSMAVGVDPTDFNRHTALGDAKWAAAIYDAVIGVRR